MSKINQYLFNHYLSGGALMGKINTSGIAGDGGHVVVFTRTSSSPVQLRVTDPWGAMVDNVSGPEAYKKFNALGGGDAYLVVPTTVGRPTQPYRRGDDIPGWN